MAKFFGLFVLVLSILSCTFAAPTVVSTEPSGISATLKDEKSALPPDQLDSYRTHHGPLTHYPFYPSPIPSYSSYSSGYSLPSISALPWKPLASPVISYPAPISHGVSVGSVSHVPSVSVPVYSASNSQGISVGSISHIPSVSVSSYSPSISSGISLASVPHVPSVSVPYSVPISPSPGISVSSQPAAISPSVPLASVSHISPPVSVGIPGSVSNSIPLHIAPSSSLAVTQSYVKPSISYTPQYLQKPVPTVVKQIISKPVIIEYVGIVKRPVITETNEVIHKPVVAVLQQVIEKPTYAEIVETPASHGAIQQHFDQPPVFVKGSDRHVVLGPVGQVIQLPTKYVQQYATEQIHIPTVSQQLETQTTYHSTVPVPHAPVVTSSSVSGYPTFSNFGSYDFGSSYNYGSLPGINYPSIYGADYSGISSTLLQTQCKAGECQQAPQNEKKETPNNVGEGKSAESKEPSVQKEFQDRVMEKLKAKKNEIVDPVMKEVANEMNITLELPNPKSATTDNLGVASSKVEQESESDFSKNFKFIRSYFKDHPQEKEKLIKTKMDSSDNADNTTQSPKSEKKLNN